MTSSTTPELGRAPRTVYARDSLEYARLVNLSDAVFAIAMTLLVLGLEVPATTAEGLASELAVVGPQLVAFLLGFALIANIWWQHHKLFARLAFADAGLVAIDLALLGAVALVPFPTGLLGSYPTARAAVLPFAAVFVLLVGLFLWLVVHAQRRAAWRHPLPSGLAPWIVGGYAVVIATMVVAMLVALVSPVAGLVVLAASNLPERVLARFAPAGYRDWS
jgi:uncharacterized membrane protein